MKCPKCHYEGKVEEFLEPLISSTKKPRKGEPVGRWLKCPKCGERWTISQADLKREREAEAT
jgi:hypothetical protein